jgi:hypothetical protein
VTEPAGTRSGTTAAHEDLPGTPVPGRPRVVAAAVERTRRGRVIRELNHVVEHGGTAVMITSEGRNRPENRPEKLHPDVQLIDLATGERRLGLNALLTRDPRRVVRRLLGGATSSGPSPAWAVVSQSKPYRMLRPWLLWRVLRRRLDDLRVDDIDHVIIVHQNSWPIAWQLHRRNPRISISWDVPGVVWTNAGRPIPPPPPPPPVEPVVEPELEAEAAAQAEDAAATP